MSSLRAISRRSFSVFVSNSATLITGFSLVLVLAVLKLLLVLPLLLAPGLCRFSAPSSLRRMRGTDHSLPAHLRHRQPIGSERIPGKSLTDPVRPRFFKTTSRYGRLPRRIGLRNWR